LAYASDAARFLERVSSQQVRIVAPEGIELETLEVLAHELGPLILDPAIARMLFHDVVALFNNMLRWGILRVVGRQDEALVESAFVVASHYNLSLADSFSVQLARDSGYPLLLADDALFHGLKHLEPAMPGFRVIWLTDLQP
jgi:hypothetical protein